MGCHSLTLVPISMLKIVELNYRKFLETGTRNLDQRETTFFLRFYNIIHSSTIFDSNRDRKVASRTVENFSSKMFREWERVRFTAGEGACSREFGEWSGMPLLNESVETWTKESMTETLPLL